MDARSHCLTLGQVHALTDVAELLTRIPTLRRLCADRAYDTQRLRDWLAERGCEAVIPPNPVLKHTHSYDRTTCRGRNVVKWVFCRLRGIRRTATRCEKRADFFLSADLHVATVVLWAN